MNLELYLRTIMIIELHKNKELVRIVKRSPYYEYKDIKINII